MSDILLNIVFRILTALGGFIVLGLLVLMVFQCIYIYKELINNFDIMLYLKIAGALFGIIIAGIIGMFSVFLFNDWLDTKISKIK
ncbi:hypothetical protein JTZ62_04745 [Mammaliicoccus sciuri]|uniref:hypothetical protein n=1 Tax=Mammaliicoccus sciuri TaxID=1296 RepID=UPI0019D34E4B|nr:hypothetical protein [Mammaliicoccus sciuri]QSN68467.1 hypothetical protein JTZ62_04745 [Mammaliicoccus sciuri]UIU23208.1 hypothetical protein LLZ87_04755 [Mammaliicoccus sciuri]UIU26113.1 hypothetical protein LLZ92_04755 [Mammaliicoccus sciuri]